ncbi:MAG: SHOCT domain-containing protein [Verrucomicrobiaceae bacterium]|nr:MAG: SHOCT domain-containing protein [Verrucomicrobiaceae bacterium]
MQSLTPQGQALVDQIASRHQLSRESVVHLVEALRRGNGTMAQFQCSEFGSGQWMQGGMTMVGDMFNHSLKARVNDVFIDLAKDMREEELFTSAKSAESITSWWPSDLGPPSSTGSQNNIRYAVFPQSKRLAIEEDGKLTLYDTGDHRIGGVSQQQGGASSVQFTSQHGSFSAHSLKMVSGQKKTEVAKQETSITSKAEAAEAKSSNPLDIAGTLRQLADLHSDGLLSYEEYAAKRKQVIDRI